MKILNVLPVAMLATGLSACIPAAQENRGSAASPVEAASDSNCDTSGLDVHLGAILTADLGEQLRKEAKAKILRVAPIDGVITMDYSPMRLNLFHDAERRIVRINCG